MRDFSTLKFVRSGLVAALLVLVAAPPAHTASSPSDPITAINRKAASAFEGKYASSKGGYRQEVEITRSKTGYAVSLVVGTEGCSGSFEGTGTAQGNKLIAHTTDPDAKDDKCRIEISRTARGIVVNENACEYWHGPSCGFDGTLRKR